MFDVVGEKGMRAAVAYSFGSARYDSDFASEVRDIVESELLVFRGDFVG